MIHCVCSFSPWVSPVGVFGAFLDFDAANSSWLLRSPLTYFRKFAFCSVGSSLWVSRRLQSLVQCPLMCQLLHTNSPFNLTDSFEHFFRLLKWVSQWYFSPLWSCAKLSGLLLSSLFRDLSLTLLCDRSRYLSFDGCACLLGTFAYSFSRCLSSSSRYHFGAMVWKLNVRILLSSLSNV